MIERFCKNALIELKDYKNGNKDDIYFNHISHRLEQSFNSYQADIERAFEYLKYRNELNLIRKLNRK